EPRPPPRLPACSGAPPMKAILRYWFIAVAIVGLEAVVSCAASRSETPKPSTSAVQTTNGYYGPGYSGTTTYAQTNGPQDQPTPGDIYARPDGGAGDREKDQNGGDVRSDSISR